MKRFLLSLAILLCTSAFAAVEEVTFTFFDGNKTNNYGFTPPYTDETTPYINNGSSSILGPITLTLNGSTDADGKPISWRNWENGLRAYGRKTEPVLRINGGTDIYIIGVKFSLSGGMTISADKGSMEVETSAKTNSWSGSEAEVSFSFGNSKNNSAIQVLTVTYEKIENIELTGTPAIFNFTDPSSLTPAFSKEDAVQDGSNDGVCIDTKRVIFTAGPVSLFVSEDTEGSNNRLYFTSDAWTYRMYTQTTVTIAASKGLTLHSIVFDSSGTESAENLRNVEFSTGEYYGHTQTLALPEGTKRVSLPLTQAVYLNKMTVYYEGEALKGAVATTPEVTYDKEKHAVWVSAPYGYHIDYRYDVVGGVAPNALADNELTCVNAGSCVIRNLPALDELATGQTIKMFVRSVDPDNERNFAPLTMYIKKDGTTAATDVIANTPAADAPAVYYNLQGVRVNTPSSGLYIRLQGPTATKVLVP